MNLFLGTFVDFLHEYLELNDINIILLSHVIKDKSDEATEYVELGIWTFCRTVNKSIKVDGFL